MGIFKSNVRPLGASSIQLLGNWKKSIKLYILNNSLDDIQEYLDEHRNILQERGLPNSDIEIKQREEFPLWFQKKVSNMQVKKLKIVMIYTLYLKVQWNDIIVTKVVLSTVLDFAAKHMMMPFGHSVLEFAPRVIMIVMTLCTMEP
ncbi:hypothetical protein AgCh_040081 [Apium graveolens]